MLSASAKAKGRRLQQLVRDLVIAKFPQLQYGDVRSQAMGSPGEDVPLSPRAREMFGPYYIETKNVEAFHLWPTVHSTRDRAAKRQMIPLVITVRNREKMPVAIVDLDHFLELCHTAWRERERAASQG